jgi:hypothetical protein
MTPPRAAYQPPFQLSHRMAAHIATIAELLGTWKAANPGALKPELRRGHRLRTLHASLAIEQNTLTLEQVTAVLDGKIVLGAPREIQEVRNANAAYDAMEQWHPHRLDDLLAAHGLMMQALTPLRAQDSLQNRVIAKTVHRRERGPTTSATATSASGAQAREQPRHRDAALLRDNLTRPAATPPRTSPPRCRSWRPRPTPPASRSTRPTCAPTSCCATACRCRPRAGQAHETVHLIDWAHPEQQRLRAGRGGDAAGGYQRRPDIVLYSTAWRSR